MKSDGNQMMAGVVYFSALLLSIGVNSSMLLTIIWSDDGLFVSIGVAHVKACFVFCEFI